jgi:hypothetical protein
VRYHSYRAVKEIEHAIVHPLRDRSKLVDAVAQRVRVRTPELVPLVLEQIDAGDQLVLSGGAQPVHPPQKRGDVPLGVEHHHDLRHRHLLRVEERR